MVRRDRRAMLAAAVWAALAIAGYRTTTLNDNQSGQHSHR